MGGMKKRRLIYPVLLLALMGTIFWFSSQVGDDSDETSGGLTAAAAHLFVQDLDSFDPQIQTQVIDSFAFIVRKTAHFCEYALMGCLWYLWLRNRKFAPLIGLGASAAYAATDELHQTLVPGRSGELRDVLVDSVGAAAGILFAFILLSVIWCVTHRDVQKWGTWNDNERK